MGDDILEALDNGKLTIGELQRSAKKYLSVYFKCSGYETSVKTVGGSEGI